MFHRIRKIYFISYLLGCVTFHVFYTAFCIFFLRSIKKVLLNCFNSLLGNTLFDLLAENYIP